MKKLMEGQKDRIRAAELPILPSSFLSETLEKETLRSLAFGTILGQDRSTDTIESM